MQDWRAQYLGLTTFPTSLTASEIDELFTLNGEIAPVVGARRTPPTRLGLVLQIGFLRLTGRSLNSMQMIPPDVLERAGQAAGICDSPTGGDPFDLPAPDDAVPASAGGDGRDGASRIMARPANVP